MNVQNGPFSESFFKIT